MEQPQEIIAGLILEGSLKKAASTLGMSYQQFMRLTVDKRRGLHQRYHSHEDTDKIGSRMYCSLMSGKTFHLIAEEEGVSYNRVRGVVQRFREKYNLERKK